MKFFTHNSRFGSIVITILLVLSILGAFLSMHNALMNSGGKISGIAILLVTVSILLSFFFLRMAYGAYSEMEQLQRQIDQLNKDAKKRKVESNTVTETNEQEESAWDEEMDINIIPDEKIDDEELFWEKVLINMSQKVDLVQGVVYIRDEVTKTFSFAGGYAYYTETKPPTFVEGETLAGQVAKNRETISLDKVPDGYITILSGLGKGSPNHLLITPLVDERENCMGVIELASFSPFTPQVVGMVEKMMTQLGDHFKTIDVSTGEEYDNSK